MGMVSTASSSTLLRHFAARARRTSPEAGEATLLPRISEFRAVGYLERRPDSAASIASKVLGSLPVVGLIARIFSDEGGIGDDIVDFAEFRRRVGKKCGRADSQAFYEFQERRGRAGDPLYVLLCCWLAAIGAGLLKSEEILEGVARLRVSNDIEFEEQNFFSMMSAAKEKRVKLRASPPEIPMGNRVEKALEAIYVCCFGEDSVEEDDVGLLITILNAVFPSVGKPRIEEIVNTVKDQVNRGERIIYPERKRLSKEAVRRQLKDFQQLKDLQFLKKDGENSS